MMATSARKTIKYIWCISSYNVRLMDDEIIADIFGNEELKAFIMILL